MEFVFESENNGMDNGGMDMMAPSAAPSDDIFAATAPVADVFDTPAPKKPTQRRKPRRKLPTDFNEIEFNEPRKPRKKTTGPKVSYVKSVKKKKRKSAKKFEWSWTKVGWMACGALVLRLFFMDAGIVDYYSMDNTLIEKERDLQGLRQENADLIKEIHKIRTSPTYQKKLAREHLGVIAKGEYLVLFANDSSGSGHF